MRVILACVVALGLCVSALAGAADDEGFVSLFNGKDLTGWDGNPDFWSVKDGAIRGETTKEKPTRGNTFCVWRGGTLKDFELHISFRINNGNSGIQYRSKEAQKWRISGYQAEVCNSGAVGFLYHERGRGSLVRVGQKVVSERDPNETNKRKQVKKNVVGSLPDAKQSFAKYKKQDWNHYRIIARGNHVQHFLNGIQTIDLIDNDEEGRCMSGVLALQIHAGAPMWVEFKDIKLKVLEPEAKK